MVVCLALVVCPAFGRIPVSVVCAAFVVCLAAFKARRVDIGPADSENRILDPKFGEIMMRLRPVTMGVRPVTMKLGPVTMRLRPGRLKKKLAIVSPFH